jgi:phenylpropionate dioxygenase-like ring-hydroxylating dioxygenase large terminal subunit
LAFRRSYRIIFHRKIFLTEKFNVCCPGQPDDNSQIEDLELVAGQEEAVLSTEQNEMLCRVGLRTPMGELMREFWIPALPSSEFPNPDCPPKRMRLLGENLVMFRDTNGRMGALAEACPHRGASLYFGRNEECGLRCVYHGWKFDVDGACMDLPTEHDEVKQANFRGNIKATAYKCREVNHMIWVYLGSRKEPPPIPEFEVNTLPSDQVAPPSIMMEEANYLQNLEGDLDTAHLDWLHRRLNLDSPKPEKGIRGFWNPERRAPRLDVRPSDYGAYYTAKRTLPNGADWHRINHFIFPFHTTITNGDEFVLNRCFVPVDDYHTMLITQVGHPTKPIPKGMAERMSTPFAAVGGYVERTNDPTTYFLTKLNRRNDFGRDFQVEQETMFNGVPFVGNLQDRAMTELMCNPSTGEPLYDRTREHLGSSDAFVIAVRRQMLDAVKRHVETGEPPANCFHPRLGRVRSASLMLPPDADWESLSKEALDPDSGKAATADVPLIIA